MKGKSHEENPRWFYPGLRVVITLNERRIEKRSLTSVRLRQRGTFRAVAGRTKNKRKKKKENTKRNGRNGGAKEGKKGDRRGLGGFNLSRTQSTIFPLAADSALRSVEKKKRGKTQGGFLNAAERRVFLGTWGGARNVDATLVLISDTDYSRYSRS